MRATMAVLLTLFFGLGTMTALAQGGMSRGQGGTGAGSPGMMGPGEGMQSQGGSAMGGQTQELRQYRYRSLDQDGDGLVSREELQQHQALMQQMHDNWQRADRNRDEVVDQDEFAAFERQMQQDRDREQERLR